ncbi:hypothetical protein OG871_35455 [Kitasatospora sp. NBC_00374]|uniref:hypothetical protein n=1 Tax=Kitasatospora sp. NBC_00374 TaxID=2975964 RepID=UPI0032452A34
MSLEDDFSQALREAAEASPPAPLGLMAAGAAQRGRRRKRRRAVAASAAAVAALGCLGALTLQLRPVAEAAGPSVATSPASSATPTAPAVASPSAPADSARLLELFKSKLPADLALSGPVRRDPVPGTRLDLMVAAYTASDGHGTGGVEISLGRVVPWPGWPANVEGCSDVPNCTTTAQPDGSYLTVYRPDRAVGGEQVWSACLRRPDGVTVLVSAGNVPGPGAGLMEPYPNAPLLSPAQLSALALDPVWLPLAGGLPASSPAAARRG